MIMHAVTADFPQVLVAKFVPDVARNEPRNVGVFLASSGRVVARFLGESLDTPGRLVARVPLLESKQDRDAYREWIAYWRIGMERMGDSMPVSERVQRLQDSSKQQFAVVRGGFLRKSVMDAELETELDRLYERLVDDPERKDGRFDATSVGRQLQAETNKLFKRTGFSDRPDFQTKYPVVCPIIGTNEKLGFHFDYGLHTVRPVSLLQKVLIEKPQSLNSALFMFQSVQSGLKIARDQCASLVYVEPKSVNSRTVRSGLKVMESYSQVINVVDTADAERRLLGLGATA